MNKKNIIYASVGLVLGMVLTGIIAGQAVNNNNATIMGFMGIKNTTVSSMSMDDMNQQLQGLSGDEFDKKFLELMIEHHRGAVNMSQLVQSRAKHEEIKKLGKSIISTQLDEIIQMTQWQNDWGYKIEETSNMMHVGH